MIHASVGHWFGYPKIRREQCPKRTRDLVRSRKVLLKLGSTGGGTFFKVGGAQMEIQKSIENFCGLNWQL